MAVTERGPETALFVGRDHPRSRMLSRLDDALAGRTRLVLVSGEAGIGKTTLVGAVADAAGDRALVSWGTCWDGASAPGYWPWTQALDAVVRRLDPDRAADLAGEDAPLLASIVPALGRAGDHAAADPAQTRLLLFDAVGRWLARLAEQRPMVVVLDDLQWADRSSLELLDFVVRAQHTAALLLVGAYRHDELAPEAGVLLAGLASRAEHIHLEGLSRDEVAVLVGGVVGTELAGRWADAVHRRTGGHPFFVRELASLLDAHGGRPGGAVPTAVRDAIGRRLDRLSATTRSVVEAAAVAGNDVIVDVLAETLDVAPPAVSDAVDEAAGAGVVRRAAGGRPRFVHDLVRETVYNALPAAARLSLHQRIAAALGRRATGAGDVAAAEVARHFAAAVPVDGYERALHWALAAAEADRARLAFAEAAAQLTRLRLALADGRADVPDATWVDLLVAEADALARAGDPETARALLERARVHAGSSGDPGRLAAVAFGVQRLGARFAMPRQHLIDLLDEARQAVAGLDPSTEAQLTAALARELSHSVAEHRPRAGRLTQEALALARKTGNPSALADCLIARHDVLWTPGTALERLEVARDIVELAERLGDDDRRVEGLLLVANALLEAGSPAFRPALDAYIEAVEALGQPRHHYLALTRRGALALLDGHLDDAAELIDDTARLGERIGEPDTGNVAMSQRLELTRARDDPDEQRSFATEAVRWWTGAPVHAHAVAAGFLARAGDLGAARRHVDVVLELGTWAADRSYLWSVFVGNLAEAAVRLGDTKLCARLLSDLVPLASSCGVNGAVVAFAGSLAHFAGLAAAALGQGEEATALLTQALEIHTRLGAAVWEQQSRSALDALDVAPRRAGSPPQPVAILRRGERTWTISYRSQKVTVPDLKGWRDLATLLRHPGVDVHVLELTGAEVVAGAPGEAADRRAISAYRARLVDLEDDRTEAEHHHDPARIERIDAERAALLDELGRVTGLGGRPRQLGATAGERARKAVSARIRDAIRRLEPLIPELAAHLDRSIVTGTWCRYRGDAGTTWQVEP